MLERPHMMSSWQERYQMACRHVAGGRQVIDRQRAIVDRQRARGFDSRESERLLEAFERSQGIFEDDLNRICRERNKSDVI
jgi:hypothetical protein